MVESADIRGRHATEQAYGRGGAAALSALATVAIVAELSSRGVAPALPGVWIGAAHAITALKLVAAISSQLFAVASTAVVIGLVLAMIKSAAPSSLRAFSVGVGVLTILAVMIASAVKLPSVSRLVLATGAAALALACSARAARYFTSRAASLVCGAIAASGLVRLAAILLAGQASQHREVSLGVAARVLATGSLALAALAVLVTLIWVSRARTPHPRSFGRRGRSVVRGLVLLTVGASVGVLTGLVTLGSDPEASGVSLLVARTFAELSSRPEPYGSSVIYTIHEALRWSLALAALVVAPRSRPMAVVFALALVAGGTLEVPLCAAALVIASLALVLHPGPDLRHDVPPERQG